MSESVLCPVLIGRANELVLLEDLLRQAADGTGRVVVVTGDAGIGKSRLVAELVGKAAAGGAQVLAGACAYRPAENTASKMLSTLLPIVRWLKVFIFTIFMPRNLLTLPAGNG